MGIGQNYKERKKNVIDIFKIYKVNRGSENDGIDIDFLENRIKSLQDGKYTLAIAGEVKAGKSTFINALLKEEVLPTGVLQATSAIIEIFKSEKSYLKIKFADGSVEEVYEDANSKINTKIKKRLNEICCLNEEYRTIPTTILNKKIIENENEINVTTDLINKLNQEANTKIEFLKDKDIIKKYIAEHNKKNIPVNIEFGYPFKWSFDEFRIVDTPGVNAVGGVQYLSYKYLLKNANAVLFVKSIDSIESASFKNLVDFIIDNKINKDSLFLVLTKIGKEYENFETLYNEAIRIYENDIPNEKILAVDSILSLIHDDLDKGLSLEEIEKQEEGKNNKPKTQVIPYFEKKAKKNKIDNISNFFQDCSRFKEMNNSINKFSSIASDLQLREILDKIEEAYEYKTEINNEEINRLKQVKKNPQEFEEIIKKLTNALNDYHNLSLNTKRDIEKKYKTILKDNDDFNKIQNNFNECLQKTENIENTKKNLIETTFNLEDFINGISQSIKGDFVSSFKKMGKSFKNEYDITLPRVDFDSIEFKAMNNAYEEVDIFEERERNIDGGDIVGGVGGALAGAGAGAAIGSIFPGFGTLIGAGIGGLIGVFGGGIGTRKVRGVKETIKVGSEIKYNTEKHHEEYIKECKTEFYTIILKLTDIISDFLKKFSEIFEIELNNVIDERKKDLENELKKKHTNQEIIEKINKLEKINNETKEFIKGINELKANLSC